MRSSIAIALLAGGCCFTPTAAPAPVAVTAPPTAVAPPPTLAAPPVVAAPPTPPTAAAEAPPPAPAAPAAEPLVDWSCACITETVAGERVTSTACRPTRRECEQLLERAMRSEDDDMDAAWESCRSTGPVAHPGDRWGGREQWQPSSRPGSWQAPRTCYAEESAE